MFPVSLVVVVVIFVLLEACFGFYFNRFNSSSALFYDALQNDIKLGAHIYLC